VLFSTLLHRLLDARVATVLVIEDVHWADEATLDLIRFLARRLRLAPRSRQGVAVLAGPHGVDPDALYETTGGNPFFITEVLAPTMRRSRPPCWTPWWPERPGCPHRQ
jgi:predicted ATPase